MNYRKLVLKLVLGAPALAGAWLVLQAAVAGWTLGSLFGPSAAASIDLAHYGLAASPPSALASAMGRLLAARRIPASPERLRVPIAEEHPVLEPPSSARAELRRLLQSYLELGKSAEAAKAKLELLPRLRLFLTDVPSETEAVSGLLAEDIVAPVALNSETGDPVMELALRAQNVVVGIEPDPGRAMQITLGGIQAQGNEAVRARFAATFSARYPDRRAELEARLEALGLGARTADPSP